MCHAGFEKGCLLLTMVGDGRPVSNILSPVLSPSE